MNEKVRKFNNNMKSHYIEEKAITLIVLVIIIIILLILAGIVINLALGQNGLFNHTQEAGLKYDEQQSREKLEIVLLDMQADKIVNSEYNQNDYLTSKIEENNMIVNDDIVVVDEWQFQIDRSVPKITSSLGKGETIIITSPYIGTTSFTTSLKHIYNESEVEAYTYIIDGVEEITTKEKEYTKDGLDAESKHKVKVITKYKDGTTLGSNTLNITLEPRTYLYNNGDQCIDITGGWKVAKIGCNNSATVVIPRLTFNENYMNLYVLSSYEMQGGSLLINNNIDYTKYKKICFTITGTLGKYNSSSSVKLFMNSQKPISLERFLYTSPITTKTMCSADIENIENIEDLYIYIQSHSVDGAANCNIYEVWLEK